MLRKLRFRQKNGFLIKKYVYSVKRYSVKRKCFAVVVTTNMVLKNTKFSYSPSVKGLRPSESKAPKSSRDNKRPRVQRTSVQKFRVQTFRVQSSFSEFLKFSEFLQ